MPSHDYDPFAAQTTLKTPSGSRTIYRLDALSERVDLTRLPYCIKVLLEAGLRHLDGHVITDKDVQAIVDYNATDVGEVEIPFRPSRVVLQDFTGVPAVVDLAAMRSAIVRITGDPSSAQHVNPLVPCDLVCDHSVQVDAFASSTALTINNQKEFERNSERYSFLKWGQNAFETLRVVPPATGIVHQINLEYLAKGIWDNDTELYPDSVVGTDSHTTMINGLGVLGWGVGGIEAEAVMLGQPIYMLLPEVIGVRLIGQLPAGATSTDMVLRVTQLLREYGVVGKFVEYFGPGLDSMPLANRATIANMAPEYGATMGFFPIDQHTIDYLQLTGRDAAHVETVEQYCREQGLWRDETYQVQYSDVLELDLSTIVPAIAGPKRPQDRIAISDAKSTWEGTLSQTFQQANPRQVDVSINGTTFKLSDGAVCIAAITSCTNTSNPEVLIAAGLLAKKANELGLTRQPWVKSSFGPGSRVVSDYLDSAGLTPHLEALGFHIIGYGCTTCIGNSGPLPEPISEAITEQDLVVCSVLSGNRNFEGRISPHIKANYLASPPLVVAYALAGRLDIDLTNESLGTSNAGDPVYLKDIWPTEAEIHSILQAHLSSEQFQQRYANVFAGSDEWQAIQTSTGALYEWDEASTYVKEPPFFTELTLDPQTIQPISGARVLCRLGDSVTTDHISPAGSIASDSPAGQYLIENGIPVSAFNSFGSRRGNDRVMTRGTFGNIRVRNHLAPGTEGGWTTFLGNGAGEVMTIYDAACKYKEVNTPLVVLAGKDYGMGSSRDWAAKGTYLLGVKAVIAESFERIHRSNLVGMGVLPLTFQNGENADSLGLDGMETFDIRIDDNLQPRQDVAVSATRSDGSVINFTTTCRVDTPVEIEYYRKGGILHTVLRNMASK